jgi:hypothetical protein
LAETLPLESADMYFDRYGAPYFINVSVTHERIKKDRYHHFIPCWSLAALLATLPNEIITDNKFECHYQIDIRKYDGGNNTILYQIAYGNNRGSSGSWHDIINTGEKENLIDCCVQMILKLYELKML